jgi:hypothetical protein
MTASHHAAYAEATGAAPTWKRYDVQEEIPAYHKLDEEGKKKFNEEDAAKTEQNLAEIAEIDKAQKLQRRLAGRKNNSERITAEDARYRVNNPEEFNKDGSSKKRRARKDPSERRAPRSGYSSTRAGRRKGRG